MNNKKGFTLIELLVVVLIIGILAAMALPAYFKAVERSRIAEADTLMGTVAQAQQRRYMKTNSYSTKFSGLDVSPTTAAQPVFCTKGGATGATSGVCDTNGFAIILDSDKVEAKRVGSGEYGYSLSRLYQDTSVTCTTSGKAGDAAICAEYCGIDSLTGSACCNDGSDYACGATPELGD